MAVLRVSEFQSTHPRGVRHSEPKATSSLMKISIHAPTWGATTLVLLLTKVIIFQSTHPRGVRRSTLTIVWIFRTFQSTHPRGVRPGVDAGVDAFVEFQSTHPRGVRLNPVGSNFFKINFNPRTHVGCDATIWSEYAR